MKTMTEYEEVTECRDTEKNKDRLTGTLLMTTLGIATGSFTYGYNITVLNGPHLAIKDFINTTTHDQTGHYLTDQWVRLYWSTIVAVFALGGAVGAGAAGWWALVFGRKRGCLTNTVLGFIAIGLMVLSPTFHAFSSLIVGRFVIGIHCGLYTMLCPLFLNEISTPGLRGPLGVVHQLGTVVGMLAAQVLGFHNLLGSGDRWIVLLGFSAVPLLLQITWLCMCPESPGYLARVLRDRTATRQALVLLRGTMDVDEELLQLTEAKDTVVKERSFVELIQMEEQRATLGLAIVIMMSPHLAGSIAVVFYSSMIFEAAGASPVVANYETAGIGAILVLFSILSLKLVNKVGRRPLLLAGLSVMGSASIVIVGLQYFQLTVATVVAVLVFILGFAIGPGPVPFTVVPELFSSEVKRAALSLSVAGNWLANFSVGFLFPLILEKLDYLAFSVFAITCSLLVLFLYCLLPETKPKIEEITLTVNQQKTGALESCRLLGVLDYVGEGSGENCVFGKNKILRDDISQSKVGSN